MPKKQICPECGCDLGGMDVLAHAIDHWGGEPEKIKYPEAHARFMELYEIAQERGEVR